MKIFSALALTSLCFLTACAPQSTPSMMNTSLPRLEESTNMQQIPVADVSEGYLHKIAMDYHRYGTGPVQLTLVHDEKSKTYKKMNAFSDMARFKEKLTKLGVQSVKAEVLDGPSMEPTLMVSYDSVTAAAPAGCRNMPGFDDGLTTREIGDYKFGCTRDTMIAKQIYRPADLAGNTGSDDIDGRRAANTVEYNRQVTGEEAEGELRVYSRDDIQQ